MYADANYDNGFEGNGRYFNIKNYIITIACIFVVVNVVSVAK